MLIDEACFIKDAEFVEGTASKRDLESKAEAQLFNEVLSMQGQPKIKSLEAEETYRENGVLLTLWCPKTGKEYKRFMPESLLREKVVGESPSPLTPENLIFLAEQYKNRKHPITVTILSNEIEGEEYQKALENSPNNEVKFKMLGKPKKKGKKK